MPAAEVEFDNGYESFCRVLNQGHWQQCLWVLHKAVSRRYQPLELTATNVCMGSPKSNGITQTYFVILSSMLLGSRIKVGSVIRLKSAPGRSCEMIESSTIAVAVNTRDPESLNSVPAKHANKEESV